MIVLDTATLLWFTLGDERLAPRSRGWFESDEEFIISAITPWEVAMLAGRGRLGLGQSPLSWINKILDDPRMSLAPISPKLAVAAGLLPRSIQGDPGDRLILATAIEQAAPLLTPDEKILAYATEGHVQAIDARR